MHEQQEALDTNDHSQDYLEDFKAVYVETASQVLNVPSHLIWVSMTEEENESLRVQLWVSGRAATEIEADTVDSEMRRLLSISWN